MTWTSRADLNRAIGCLIILITSLGTVPLLACILMTCTSQRFTFLRFRMPEPGQQRPATAGIRAKLICSSPAYRSSHLRKEINIKWRKRQYPYPLFSHPSATWSATFSHSPPNTPLSSAGLQSSLKADDAGGRQVVIYMYRCHLDHVYIIMTTIVMCPLC